MPRAGELPPPACIFIPADNLGLALHCAACAHFAGLSACVKPGTDCAIWSAGPLASSAPAYATKVVLPAGMSASTARQLIRDAAQQLALQGY